MTPALALLLLATAQGGRIAFEDASEKSGVSFRHVHGGSGEKHLPETMGAGVALFDADGDGNLDLFFVQSGPLPGYAGSGDARDRLYLNEGGWRWRDATDEAGLRDAEYGMGTVVGDFDGDGDPDLYVTNFGPDRYWRNVGGGRFGDATARAGLGDSSWGTSAAAADLDLDGDLDLVVVNYLRYELARNPWCGRKEPGWRTYCHPDAFEGATDRLYRNEGDGTFVEVGLASGLREGTRSDGKGLGVVCADLDLDGDLEIYVANDSTANFLYRNDGPWRFVEIGALAGVAFNESGLTEAGMGVDAADGDGDGRFDLFVTNLDEETNTFYRSRGALSFEDATVTAGLATPSLTRLGFGTFFFDPDGDGDADLFVGNGHLLDNVRLYKDNTHYAQRDQVFENDGRGRFREVEASGGLALERVSRSAACADLDGDLDPDVVVTVSDGAATLLRNAGGDAASFLAVALRGRRSNREGVGALVRVRAGGREALREARRGCSYLACEAGPLLFGLRGTSVAEEVLVRWPSGVEERFRDVPGGSVLRVVEGETGSAGGESGEPR